MREGVRRFAQVCLRVHSHRSIWLQAGLRLQSSSFRNPSRCLRTSGRRGNQPRLGVQAIAAALEDLVAREAAVAEVVDSEAAVAAVAAMAAEAKVVGTEGVKAAWSNR